MNEPNRQNISILVMLSLYTKKHRIADQKGDVLQNMLTIDIGRYAIEKTTQLNEIKPPITLHSKLVLDSEGIARLKPVEHMINIGVIKFMSALTKATSYVLTTDEVHIFIIVLLAVEHTQYNNISKTAYNLPFSTDCSSCSIFFSTNGHSSSSW